MSLARAISAMALATTTALTIPQDGQAQSCPTSTACSMGTCSSSSPTASVTGYGHDSGSGGASYNLVAGTASAYGTGGWQSDGWGRATMVDDYHVVGVQAGTALNLQVRLRATGTGAWCETCGAYFTAELQTPAGARSVTGGAPYGSCSHGTDVVLTVDLPHVVGDTFRLTMSVQGNGSNLCTGSGSIALSFAGLPAGAAVVSCHGYTSDPAVAARPTTWGALKLRYR